MNDVINFFFKLLFINSSLFWVRFLIYGALIWLIFSILTYFIYKKFFLNSKLITSPLNRLLFSKLYAIIVIAIINSVMLFFIVKINGWKSFDFLSFSFNVRNSYTHLSQIFIIYFFSIIFYFRLKNRIK